MVLTEFDEERYEKAMKEEGAEQMGMLILALYEAGRDEDVKLAIVDNRARERFFDEFNIEW